MPIEANAVARFGGVGRGEGRGFAYVMEQHPPGERGTGADWKVCKQHQRVDPDIALGMILRRLFDALHSLKFRQYLGQQAAGVEKLEATPRRAFSEDAGEFFADALRRYLGYGRCLLAYRRKRSGFDFKAQSSRKANGTQHAKLVFGEAQPGIADGAEDLLMQIGLAADKVQHAVFQAVALLKRERVQQQAVDGEVTPQDILARIGREPHSIRPPPIAVRPIVAKSGDLRRDAFAFVVGQHQHNAKMRAYGLGARKGLLDFFGGCGGGYVEILRVDAKQHIAHASAREVGRKAALTQPPRDRERFNVMWVR